MPAAAAMSSTVVASKPRAVNSRMASRSMSSRVVAGGRPTLVTTRAPTLACPHYGRNWHPVPIFGPRRRFRGALMTSTAIEPTTETADVVEATDEDVLAEVLVEEISIDG